MGERLLSEISEIYEAALDPARWESFLHLVSKRYPGCGAYLWLEDKERADVSVGYGVGTDSAMLRDYEAHYASVNPWTEVMLAKPVGHVHTGPMLVPDEIFQHSEFYNDWLKPQALRAGFGVNVLRDQRHTFFFSICMEQQSDAGRDELRLMRQLFPHLERAARLYGHLSRLTQRCELAEQVLDQVQIGTVILDRDRKVAFANREAQRIAVTGDGLALSGPGLQTTRLADGRRLEAEIAAAYAMARGEGLAQGGAIAVSRPSGAPAYVVYVVPLAVTDPPSGFALGLSLPAVALFISDPEHRATTPAQALQRLYGLTPAEARLAEALVKGWQTKDAAEAFGVTQETIKSQLKSVFAKTDVNSQAKLVRRVLADLAGLPMTNLSDD